MIQILLFASLAQQAGKQKIELEVNEKMSVQQVMDKLQQQIGTLKGLDNCLFALNEEYIDREDVVEPGDTLAFIPPVSGG